MTGLAEPTAVRSHFPTPEQAARIVARATALRGGVVVGDGDTSTARRDVLSDVLRVWAFVGDRPGVHWHQLARLLAEHQPEAYTGTTAEALSALVRGEGVPSVDVKVDGEVRKGVRLAEVHAAVQQRAIEGSGSTALVPKAHPGGASEPGR